MVDLNGKKVMVTGCAGFIGYNFFRLILKKYKGMKLFGIDNFSQGSLDFLRKETYELKEENGNRYTMLYGDLTISTDIAYHFENFNNLDYVFHFAAQSHVDRSIQDPTYFVKNNVVSTTNLLEFVRNYSPNARVVVISTDEVYGHLDKGDNPFTEKSPLNPRSPYSASKAASDLVALSYYHTYGLNVVVTRCCNNFGPYQNKEKFIPTIINRLKAGKKIPVYGNGLNIREWIYVDDHNLTVLKIAGMEESGEVFNIGSGVEKTNLELIEDIAKLSNMEYSNNLLEFVEDRKGHDFRYALVSDKVETIIEVPYYDRLKETIKFYEQ